MAVQVILSRANVDQQETAFCRVKKVLRSYLLFCCSFVHRQYDSVVYLFMSKYN